ncbi:MAG: terminase large subunit [Planctomycetaceae bacterium]
MYLYYWHSCRKILAFLEWQKAFIHRLFSWRNHEGNRADDKICSCWIPRGAGKTEFAAALTLYMTLGDGENDPSIVFAASSRDQATWLFDLQAASFMQILIFQNTSGSEITGKKSRSREVKFFQLAARFDWCQDMEKVNK